MSRSYRITWLIVLSCMSTVLPAVPSFGDWQLDGTPVCMAAEDQTGPCLVSDGAGGAIVTWNDDRGGGNDGIWAQRVSANGVVLWSVDGVSVGSTGMMTSLIESVADGAGGAIVIWEYANTGEQWPGFWVYDAWTVATRINSNGSKVWSTLISYRLSMPDWLPLDLGLTSDGAGGAILAWSEDGYIFANRIDASGNLLWEEYICSAMYDQLCPQVVTDGAGGAIVTWEDYRSGSNYDVYAQRVNASGSTLWTYNGIPICTAIGSQRSPELTSDGTTGGAIVTWLDYRSGSNSDIYAQRVNSSGTALWTYNGTPICTATDDQWGCQLTPDGAAGAIVTWRDYRSGSNYDVYAQRVNASGTALWTSNGVPICTATGSQSDPELTPDGVAGAIVTWSDYRSGSNYDVYAQRVNASGTALWTSNGVPICAATGSQSEPVPMSDGAGGAFIVWPDCRNGSSNSDIYAQRVTALGNVFDVTPPQVTVVRPNGGEVFYCWTQDTIRWVATDNVGVTRVDLLYSTNGGSTYPYTIATSEANDSVYVWDVPFRNSTTCKVKVVAYDAGANQGNDVSDNNFRITPDMNGPEVTVERPNGGEVFYEAAQDTIRWAAVDEVGVDSVNIYYSTDGGNTYPYTVATSEPNDGEYLWTIPATYSTTCKVKVIAYDPFENPGEDVSDADFTIAPPPDITPPEVTVVRPNGGEIFYVTHEDTIRWVATDEFGVDSVSIYYSTDGGATFPNVVATGEPNDSLCVWTVPDTPSDNCVVKVVAYDTSENSGENVSDAVFSIETSVAVEPAPGVNVFGLAQNYPNPFNPLTRMEFNLGARSHVLLKIYDISGKPVRTLVDETLGAGRHSVLWNGEDESGRPVASGVYVTRLEAEGRTAMCKSVLLR